MRLPSPYGARDQSSSEAMGCGVRASIGFAVLMQCCLAPPWVVAQVREAAPPAGDQGVETSIRGHLQRRIASAYPDSFRVGIDIFWEPSDGWVSPEVLE